MSDEVIELTEDGMKNAVEHTAHEFGTLHTGKASPSMVENIMIEAYGSSMRLRDCAAITTPDSRLIQIQPWDKSVINAIEKAIQTANLGFNPVINGGLVRVPIPELSRERREDLVKVTHRMAEEGRISIRHARREGMDALKDAKKEGTLSEDDQKRYEKEIQALTDKYTKEIDVLLKEKEDELLKV